MRIALDTNVLAYAEGVNGAERRAAAIVVLDGLGGDEVLIPAQALVELFVVLTRRAGTPAPSARDRVLSWADAYPCIETSLSVIAEAMELSAAHRLASWDAIVVASAAAAGCRILLTADMQHGFAWRGLTLRDPFRPDES